MPNDYWETPKDLFEGLNTKFHFTWDVCATDKNTLLDNYWNEKDDALAQDWGSPERYFMNPPYSRKIRSFLEKTHYEVDANHARVIALIPATVGTVYFQDFCLDKNVVKSIYFIKGRLKYTLNGTPVGTPRFDSCIVDFDSENSDEGINFFKTNRDFSKIVPL